MNYTVAKDGSTIVALNPSGGVVASGLDFGSVFNSVNSLLAPYDIVWLRNYIYPISTRAELTKTYITVDAEAGAKIVGQPAIGTNNLMHIKGAHNEVKHVGFDDNFRGGNTAVVFVMGSYNTLRECKLVNCDRYGFSTWIADHFSILNNITYQAQYGISGSDNGLDSKWSTNGLVQGNQCYNSRDAGIKMKMWKNVLVTGNYVDIGYITWGKSGVPNGQFGSTRATDGCTGIWFYHLDTPTQNVIVSDNTIINSVPVSNEGIGIIIDPDSPGDWPGCPYPAQGEKIFGNLITVPWYGIILEKGGIITQRNKFVGVTTEIDNRGTGNTVNGNIFAKTKSGRRKITLTTNLSTPMIVQGFELALNEVAYTEQGGVLTIGAKAVSGYSIDHFIVNGANVAPDANGLIALTVGAMDYTVQAIYVKISDTYALNYLRSTPAGVALQVNGTQLQEGQSAAIPKDSTIVLTVPERIEK